MAEALQRLESTQFLLLKRDGKEKSFIFHISLIPRKNPLTMTSKQVYFKC